MERWLEHQGEGKEPQQKEDVSATWGFNSGKSFQKTSISNQVMI